MTGDKSKTIIAVNLRVDEDQIINRFETFVALSQGYIYLNQPEKASSRLEQAQELLARIEQEKHLQTTPFNSWEPVIINIKKQQMESLSHQIAALRPLDSEQ